MKKKQKTVCFPTTVLLIYKNTDQINIGKNKQQLPCIKKQGAGTQKYSNLCWLYSDLGEMQAQAAILL